MTTYLIEVAIKVVAVLGGRGWQTCDPRGEGKGVLCVRLIVDLGEAGQSGMAIATARHAPAQERRQYDRPQLRSSFRALGVKWIGSRGAVAYPTER